MDKRERGSEADSGNPTFRAGATICGTLLIVALEFVLLASVYYRGQSLNHARVELASYRGAVTSVSPGPSAVQVAQRAVGVARLVRSAHIGGSAALTGAAATVVTDPSEANLAALRSAVDSVSNAIGHRQRTIDLESLGAYASLLVIASLGWMVWFRKLVARHRELQREVTEQHAQVAGEQRLAALIRNASDLVVVCDVDSTVIFCTPSSRKILGIDASDLVGHRFAERVDPDSADRFVRALSAGRRDEQQLLARLRHSDGRWIDVEGSVMNLMNNPAVGGLVLTIRDITQRLALEAQLTAQAFGDRLTGLANRQLFADRLSHALERRSAMAQPLVVLLCDLDDFKDLNDRLGHSAGDEALAVMGRRVRSVMRTGDTVARLGGDEYAILMEGTDLTAAELVAERLLDVIAEPFTLGGSSTTLHASIGLAQAVPGEMTNEDALRNADVAMYQAKNQGKARIARYESRLHEEALDRLALRRDLQEALRSPSSSGGELVLFYQPTVDMTTNDVIGYEALIRWEHPGRGFLPPGLFIPMAEESGLIAPLGSWVLREACRAAATMTPAPGSATGRTPSMAVNVAAQQLAQPGFVAEVVEVLAASGLESSRLTLEITEGVVLGDLAAITPRLTALRELGIRIAIDDFGTGYSSLAYLSHLPVDVLKVDKSFVDRVTLDVQDASVTEAIIAMGHTMKLKVVAEGVETPAQAAWLRSVNCDIGQGYVWSRPVPYEPARVLAGATIDIPGMPESTNQAGTEPEPVTDISVRLVRRTAS